MANRYSQTSPLEAFTRLGQGLKQGIGDVMQNIAAQQRMQAETSMIGQAMEEIMKQPDREGVFETGSKFMGDMATAGMSNRGVTQFYQWLNVKGSVTPSKSEQETADLINKQKAQDVKAGAIDLAVKAGTKDANIESAISSATILAAKAGTAEETEEQKLEALKVGIANAKKQNEILIQEAEVATDPRVKKAKVDLILQQIDANELSFRRGKVDLQQAQSVYTPVFFQKLIQMLEATTPLGDPVYDSVEKEQALNKIHKTMTVFEIPGIAPAVEFDRRYDPDNPADGWLD